MTRSSTRFENELTCHHPSASLNAVREAVRMHRTGLRRLTKETDDRIAAGSRRQKASQHVVEIMVVKYAG
jgi:hypothetical protein